MSRKNHPLYVLPHPVLLQQVLVGGGTGIEPNRTDDTEVIDLVFWNIASADSVEHTIGNRGLHGAQVLESQIC
jgi:hypothetical protein